MATPIPIPVTDLSAGQRVFTFPATTAPEGSASITVERNGVGGSHPWLNQLTQADTLLVDFGYSLDGGQTWVQFGQNRLNGGSVLVRGQQVPPESVIGIGIGSVFPVGTVFRAVLTASTPMTFSGSATYE